MNGDRRRGAGPVAQSETCAELVLYLATLSRSHLASVF